jgi:hypothetical protein
MLSIGRRTQEVLARRRFVPSMRHRIDVAGLYADALRALPVRLHGQPPQHLTQLCPFPLDQFLSGQI